MSADFLTSYLAFGPLRHKVGKASSQALPVSIDPITVQEVTCELIELARARDSATRACRDGYSTAEDGANN